MRLGDLDLDPDARDGAVPSDVPIQHITAHERYFHGNKIVNDIAILKLQNSVAYTGEFFRSLGNVCINCGLNVTHRDVFVVDCLYVQNSSNRYVCRSRGK